MPDVDLDDLFAYSTVKMVKVRDFRLGLLHLLLKVAIFLYVLISAIIIDKGYQVTEPISFGSVVASAKASDPKPYAYCCTGSGCPTRSGTGPLACLFLDSAETTFPKGQDFSLSLATRITTEPNFRNLSNPACLGLPLQPECRFQENRTEFRDHFVAGIEDYSILLRHGVVGKLLDIERVTGQMEGKLIEKAGGEPLLEWPMGDAKRNERGVGLPQEEDRIGDVIYVSELLKAAGVDLGAVKDGESVRYRGINVIVYVTYSVKDAFTRSLRYAYTPRTLSDAEFKVEPTSTGVNLEAKVRTVYNTHAIRFLFIQDGEIADWSVRQLLLSMVTSLALLAIASTVVDNLMTRVLAFKQYYKSSKYDVTEDFSKHRDQAKADSEERSRLEDELDARQKKEKDALEAKKSSMSEEDYKIEKKYMKKKHIRDEEHLEDTLKMQKKHRTQLGALEKQKASMGNSYDQEVADLTKKQQGELDELNTEFEEEVAKQVEKERKAKAEAAEEAAAAGDGGAGGTQMDNMV